MTGVQTCALPIFSLAAHVPYGFAVAGDFATEERRPRAGHVVHYRTISPDSATDFSATSEIRIDASSPIFTSTSAAPAFFVTPGPPVERGDITIPGHDPIMSAARVAEWAADAGGASGADAGGRVGRCRRASGPMPAGHRFRIR